MSRQDLLLRVEDLRVDRGGIRILDIPCFSLYGSEFISLIGPNGCGKSTLLLSVMGLLPRVSGRIVYKGRDIDSDAKLLEYRRRMAMVFQEPLLFDTTVYKNVASGLKLRKLSRREVKKRVLACLERFDLARMGHRHARKLSGGEARRVSLARAFAVEPDLIFFDEPFANLDPPTRQALAVDMERIIRETGISAVLVTHDQAEALRLSDRIMVMSGGKIVQDGLPIKVMNNPANAFVANFFGMETLLEGIVLENRDREITVSIAGKRVQAVGDAVEGERVYCGIRPENVTVGLVDSTDRTSARNVFPATIRDIASLGPFLRLDLDCGIPLIAYVTRESCAAMALESGRDVIASFKATSVHLISRVR
jgi:tungstate transport system ATP-binding protein